MSELYLCYDLKGIQSFIFAVPRLKYISGGSALIDQFDHETALNVEVKGAKRVFSGGGKGAFACDGDAAATLVQALLVKKAHEVGLSICFGLNADFTEASHVSDRSFPYLPKSYELEGHPCEESGLFPVAEGGVHWTIRMREWTKGNVMCRWFEDQLLEKIRLPSFIAESGKCEFMRDVSDRDEDGKRGFEALGARNRWAVVSMDGNDMGSQHRVASEKWKDDPSKLLVWLEQMSDGLDQCSRGACKKAIERVIALWAADRKELDAAKDDKGCICLPIRPLIVGGDDIVVICHVRYAMEFVREATAKFNEISHNLATNARAKGVELWPATGGELTISAGVLFTSVSLPLATAIPYSESLMASAKGLGRKLNKGKLGSPSPACVDWESVTEGVIDTPAARRGREFRFLDEDIGEDVELTRRPYSMEGMDELMKLADAYSEVPGTIRHQVLPELRAGYWDRQAFVARIRKHQVKLAADLNENTGRWKKEPSKTGERERPCRSTDVVDALLLLEERGRMEIRTGRKENV